jgi:hypothetical protein
MPFLFPPPSVFQAAAFYDAYLSRVPKVLAYSSTAVYRVDTPGQPVDEKTPLKQTARVQLDAMLQARGALFLACALVFPPFAHPSFCLSAPSSLAPLCQGVFMPQLHRTPLRPTLLLARPCSLSPRRVHLPSRLILTRLYRFPPDATMLARSHDPPPPPCI